MITRYNLEQRAHRLRKRFVALNQKISDTATKPGARTAAELRVITVALRSLRRTYDDLRAVEAKLRKMP